MADVAPAPDRPEDVHALSAQGFPHGSPCAEGFGIVGLARAIGGDRFAFSVFFANFA